MGNYDTNDLDFTWDGDFMIGKDGDLADTSDDLIRSLENEVRTVVRSEIADWQKHPIIGANLSDYRGEANTRKTGEKIQERIISSIVEVGIVRSGDIDCKVIPVSRHQVLAMVNIRVASTEGNRLEPGERVVVTFTYDSLEDSVFFLPPSTIEREAL